MNLLAHAFMARDTLHEVLGINTAIIKVGTKGTSSSKHPCDPHTVYTQSSPSNCKARASMETSQDPGAVHVSTPVTRSTFEPSDSPAITSSDTSDYRTSPCSRETNQELSLLTTSNPGWMTRCWNKYKTISCGSKTTVDPSTLSRRHPMRIYSDSECYRVSLTKTISFFNTSLTPPHKENPVIRLRMLLERQQSRMPFVITISRFISLLG